MSMRMRFISALAAASIFALASASAPSAKAQTDSDQRKFDKAIELLDRGMFNKAEKIFDELGETGAKSDAEGYSILCEVKMRAKGYETRMLKYLEKKPYSVMVPAIRYQYAMNLFDSQEYGEAADQFALIPIKQVKKNARPAYLFYKSYSLLESGRIGEAIKGFKEINTMPESDFSAPARYTIGYLSYEDSEFEEALKWFGKSVDDSRFQEMSLYYIIECRFLLKDYDYVTDFGPKIFEKSSDNRKTSLARFISEAFLVKGQPEKAKDYFEYNRKVGSAEKSRTDWFYAGSLLYQLENFREAVDCFSKVDNRIDSLGQATDYHLGYSYLSLRNKVAALDAFKAASQLSFNRSMEEDAFFNYAKLAFDLNSDTSVFYEYLKKYTDKKKGDKIHSYIAVAALINKDYQAAIEAYDKIDEFDEDMKDNYVKSNFLRASQLIGKGNYRSAIPCLRAISFYTGKNSGIGLLSRFWLAESYFRIADYSKASSTYTELYNLSSFYGRPEYDNILYGLAYCNFMEEKYPTAIKWLDSYLQRGVEGSKLSYRKDALERKGDCLYITGKYKEASAVYDTVVVNYFDKNDIYPYYQSAISHGLIGDNAKKISLLENVLKADSTANYYPDAMYELGRSYVSARKDNEAYDAFKILSVKSPNANYKAKAYLEMGMLSRNNGRIDEAIANYKYIIENISETDHTEDAFLALEALYKSLHQPEIYLEYIASIGKGGMKTDSEKEEMLFNAAESIYAGGNYEKSLVSLRKFLDAYPNSTRKSKVEYYIAQSYKELNNLEKASEFYKKVMNGSEAGSIKELSTLNYAEISYGFEKYDEAYKAYAELSENASLSNQRNIGRIGMMRSAFYGHNNANTISAAQDVLQHNEASSPIGREASWAMAKSYIYTSQRNQAIDIYTELSKDPSDAFGAEASWFLIQDAYDKGDFAQVESRVYAFADSGTPQMYWLAKSFIVLGDAFVEQGNITQAKATYESVKAGYSAQGQGDDTIENVDMRLNKLADMAY